MALSLSPVCDRMLFPEADPVPKTTNYKFEMWDDLEMTKKRHQNALSDKKM